MPINDPNHNFSDSRKTYTRTKDCSVFPQCLNPLFCYLDRKQRKHAVGKPLLDRWCRVNVKERINGTVSRKFYSDGWDLREHLRRRAQQAITVENSIQRKLYLNESNMEIQKSERRNSEYALLESQRELESQGQHSLEANQSKLNEREYICGANWRWRIIFIKKAMQEVAEKLKNWEYDAIRKKIRKNNEDWHNFPTQHDQESRTVSLFFYDLDLLSSYVRSSSSSCYLEFKKA